MDRGVAHQGERVGLAEHAQGADDLLQRLVELQQGSRPAWFAEEVVQHLFDVGEAGEHLLRHLLERGALLRLAGHPPVLRRSRLRTGLAALQGEQTGGDLFARAPNPAGGGRRSSAPSRLSSAVATSMPEVSTNCSGSRRSQRAKSSSAAHRMRTPGGRAPGGALIAATASSKRAGPPRCRRRTGPARAPRRGGRRGRRAAARSVSRRPQPRPGICGRVASTRVPHAVVQCAPGLMRAIW